MESGAPLLLFGHTFTSPGIVVFATNRNLNRIVFIKVVNEDAHCGSMENGLPHPATSTSISAFPLEFPGSVRFGSPDWSTLFITFGIVLLIAICLLLMQYQLRVHYWIFAPPLQVEHDNDTKDTWGISIDVLVAKFWLPSCVCLFSLVLLVRRH